MLSTKYIAFEYVDRGRTHTEVMEGTVTGLPSEVVGQVVEAVGNPDKGLEAQGRMIVGINVYEVRFSVGSLCEHDE